MKLVKATPLFSMMLLISALCFVSDKQNAVEPADTEAISSLIEKSRSGDFQTKYNAIRKLILELDNPEKRDGIEGKLFMIGRGSAIPILEKTLFDNDWKVRMNSARAIFYYIGKIVKYKNANDELVEFKPNAWDEEKHWPRINDMIFEGKIYARSISYGIGAETRLFEIVDPKIAFKKAQKWFLQDFGFQHRLLIKKLANIERTAKKKGRAELTHDQAVELRMSAMWEWVNIGMPNNLILIEASFLKEQMEIERLKYELLLWKSKVEKSITQNELEKAKESLSNSKQEYENFLKDSWCTD